MLASDTQFHLFFLVYVMQLKNTPHTLNDY